MDKLSIEVTISFADDVLVNIPGSVPGVSREVYLGKLSSVLVLSLHAIAEKLEELINQQDPHIH